MSRADVLLDKEGRYTGLWIECPGCDVGHHVVPTDWLPPGVERAPESNRDGWHFNGDLERPTLSPSILVRCEWGPERRPLICHSFVREGRIEFLADCTHALAGQTVDLPETER